jgi:hypothetical protein
MKRLTAKLPRNLLTADDADNTDKQSIAHGDILAIAEPAVPSHATTGKTGGNLAFLSGGNMEEFRVANGILRRRRPRIHFPPMATWPPPSLHFFVGNFVLVDAKL